MCVCVRVRVRVRAIERKGSELSSKSEHRVLPSSPTHEFSLMTLHTEMIQGDELILYGRLHASSSLVYKLL